MKNYRQQKYYNYTIPQNLSRLFVHFAAANANAANQ
jgi:hypothetical protein